MRKSRHYRLHGKPRASTTFRRPRLLIIGCGDVGLRLARLLHARHPAMMRVRGTTRRSDQTQRLHAANVRVLHVDLDRPDEVTRLGALARWIVYLAPPAPQGQDDPRLARVLHGLARAQPMWPTNPTRFVYVSTTGVYGDCAGAQFDETRTTAPTNARALRRVAAEDRVREAARRGWLRAAILRVPGIYAGDRLPVKRLLDGLPALVRAEDVYTNHIHADDLASICLAALWRTGNNRIYHAVDDTDLQMGDYFDLVADGLGLPRPPRLSRAEITRAVSPAMLSFMSESRRLLNTRMKRELRVRLRFPTVADTLAALPRKQGLAVETASPWGQ